MMGLVSLNNHQFNLQSKPENDQRFKSPILSNISIDGESQKANNNYLGAMTSLGQNLAALKSSKEIGGHNLISSENGAGINNEQNLCERDRSNSHNFTCSNYSRDESIGRL